MTDGPQHDAWMISQGWTKLPAGGYLKSGPAAVNPTGVVIPSYPMGERWVAAEGEESHRETYATINGQNFYGDTDRGEQLRMKGVYVEEPAAPTLWQPIATAPLDGTWMLLRGGQTDRQDECDFVPPMVVGQHEAKNGRWWFASYEGGYLGEYVSPTEWMPIPA